MTFAPTAGGRWGAEIGTPESAWRTRKDTWEYLGYALSGILQQRRMGQLETGSSASFTGILQLLESLEPYWALPGLQAVKDISELIGLGRYSEAMSRVESVNEMLRTGFHVSEDGAPGDNLSPDADGPTPSRPAPHIEVLVVDSGPSEELERFTKELRDQRRGLDKFSYHVNVVPSFVDALVALVINPSIQAVILTPRISAHSQQRLSSSLRRFVERRAGTRLQETRSIRRIIHLADAVAEIRPELDVFLMAGVALESLAGSVNGRFRRVFSRTDAMDLHLSILGGITERFETPFFDAIQEYSRRPGGVFHALPVSRGGSVLASPWIEDMADFYGMNLLLAETSATSGGLDSLLDPHGAIKEAQELAARAFGSHRSYFATNGTSTANKIVHQSIVGPGDIVLVDRNCHKSHHYALVLAGASVSYLDAYPLDEHSLYGAVPLESIKRRLLAIRDAGQLDRVKMITLTNCTFDGIVYDPRRVMEECLAIKPDLVFLWDEAWFAFAGFHPVYRQRTAMHAAAVLEQDFTTADYGRRFEEQRAQLAGADTETLVRTRLLADPTSTRLRVYATQSTHKTLTSLRQGSMIHVFDQDFAELNEESFLEAFMTHTSTSPNYQILASLDIGRRQVELEGYALVQRQADLAMSIRRTVGRHALLRKYFRVLYTSDLVPDAYRVSTSPNPAKDGLASWDQAWAEDEFVVDPCRITLDITATGVDGDTFKHDYLMDGHRIQVNKTSRSNVLIMTTIGTTRSSVAYLIEVLVKIAEDLDHKRALSRVKTRALPPGPDSIPSIPLPDFSRFAPAFLTADGASGDMRSAYYLSYRKGTTEHLSSAQIRDRLAMGDVVSASFVTPYPPGFPVLVPGQCFSADILDYMDVLDTREIHGYDKDLGYLVFRPEALYPVY